MSSSLFLYDSRKKEKIKFFPLKKNEISFYSCGPTVYNRVHIGNLRSFLFADTLQRYFKFGKNFSVKWVMNLTDVDDKTIRDSQKKFSNSDPMMALKNFTEMYSEKFFEDLERLNIQKSDFFANPKATDFIPEMQNLVKKIVDNGFGYEKDNSVYFDVKKYAKFHKYGQLVHIHFDEMQSTDRVETDEYEKESASDFVLWKAKKEGEPFWEFSLNGKNCDGRPGWHIECSAMEEKILGLPFDIHSGGVDLCFPHHEDEIAQSVAGYGIDPNTTWVHNEHLMVDGKKMSKSLGNFYTLEDLEKKGFSAEVIRFFLVTNHYRTKVNLSDESLSSSAQFLKRIRNFLELAKKQSSLEENKKDTESLVSKQETEIFLQNFFTALNDDLNVSVAIAEFFIFAKNSAKRQKNKVWTSFFVKTVKIVEGVFGIGFLPQESLIPEKILNLFEKRKKARQEKNWEESDRLRAEIFLFGYEVRDGNDEGVFLL